MGAESVPVEPNGLRPVGKRVRGDTVAVAPVIVDALVSLV